MIVGNRAKVTGALRGLVGAILGGVLGYYTFVWMLDYGFYALIVPGTLLGLGFGLFSGQKSIWCGIACGVFGMGLGIFTDWRFFRLPEDESLVYFATHLHERGPVPVVLILLGGLFAFWFGVGRDRAGWGDRTPPESERNDADTASSEE